MKIKSSLGNEAEDRTGVHQGKVTTDNFDFRRVLKKERMALFLYIISFGSIISVVGKSTVEIMEPF
ncbi:hypothetical protein HO940_00005 [Streptococcus suis]|nr:hypothetical protein [Streptococcus suis]